MHRFIPALIVAAASAAALAFPPPPSGSWTEQGDAGQTIAGAQQVTGSGALTTIYGTITSSTDVDIYVIRITDEAAFQAAVVAFMGNDSVLWLFNPDGTLQTGNDNTGSSLLSTINSTGVLANGTYYLAISGRSVGPVGALNQLLLDDSYWPGGAAQYMGDGVPLDHWTGTSSFTGAYQINLSGAQFVPTPGAAALLGLGGVVMNRRRRTA